MALYDKQGNFKKVTEPEPGGFKGFVQGIAKPFLKTAATLGRAARGYERVITEQGLIPGIAEIFRLETGQDVKPETRKIAEEEKSRAYEFGALGKVSPISSKKEAAGVGLELGSYGIGVPAAKGIAGATLQTTKQAVKGTIARGALGGATAGAVTGAGESLQRDASAADTVLSSIGGGISGGVTGGILGAAALTPYFVKNLPTIAKGKLEDASSKFLNLTPRQIKLEGKSFKNTPRFIVEEGVFPMIKKGANNTLDTTEAVTSLISKYDLDENAFESVLKDSGQYFDLNKLEKRVLNSIDTPQNRAKGVEFTKQVDTIKNQFNALRENLSSQTVKSGGQNLLPAELFNQVKRGAWSATKGFGSLDDRVLSDVNYMIGHEAKDMIEEGVEDASIKSMNSRLGDFSAAIKILSDRNGTKLPGGKIGRNFARVVGSIAGAQGGPIGSIAGAVTADKIADTLADPRLTTALYNRLVRVYGRSIVSEAEDVLRKRATQRAATLRLPARGGTSPSNAPIITPPPVITETDKYIRRGVRSIKPNR